MRWRTFDNLSGEGWAGPQKVPGGATIPAEQPTPFSSNPEAYRIRTRAHAAEKWPLHKVIATSLSIVEPVHQSGLVADAGDAECSEKKTQPSRPMPA